MIPRHFQITIGVLLMAVLVSGVMLIRLRHNAQEASLGEDSGPPAGPPVAGQEEKIPILVAYDDDQALRWRNTTVS